jgi:hypothetical protein
LANTEDAALLVGIAVTEDFFKVIGEMGVGDSDASIGKTKTGISASKQALEVLDGKDCLIACREMNMEVEPPLAFLSDGTVGLNTNEVSSDMLKPVALGDLPLGLECGEGGGIKANDGILASQDGFPFRIFKAKSGEFHESAGFRSRILDAGRGVLKTNRGFQMTKGTLDTHIHYGYL